jgi:catechol 2,3-dioxygenase-like lactoylglutathione lyase family enzyme
MHGYSLFRTIIAVGATWGVAHATAQGQTAEGPGKVVGLAAVGRMVANLDQSVAFYKALGFNQDLTADPGWRKDQVIDHLYGVHGVETRMAKLFVVNAASGQPFAVYLRELKGIKRRNLAGHPAWEPGATHFSLVVPDAQSVWSKLSAEGLLRARTWGARLIAPPGQSKGTIAYLTDPDGLDIELLNERTPVPAAAGPGTDPDTRPGVGHAGIVVLDQAKAKAFYGDVLGGHSLNPGTPWLKGDFYDAVVGGHGNIMRVYDESFPEAAAPAYRVNFALIEFQNRKQPVATQRLTDIGVGYVEFEVQSLDALLSRAKAAGAVVVSRPGPVTTKDGTRAVMIRDPDVGGFVQLVEKPKAP